MQKGDLVRVKGSFAGRAIGMLLSNWHDEWWNVLMPTGEIITWPMSQLDIV
jgi:hypothetical protein